MSGRGRRVTGLDTNSLGAAPFSVIVWVRWKAQPG
jgi:hypothetical protein